MENHDHNKLLRNALAIDNRIASRSTPVMPVAAAVAPAGEPQTVATPVMPPAPPADTEHLQTLRVPPAAFEQPKLTAAEKRAAAKAAKVIAPPVWEH